MASGERLRPGLLLAALGTLFLLLSVATGLYLMVRYADYVETDGVVVDALIDLELEVLALPHIGDAGDSEPAERTDDRLALRVEDLRFEDDVHGHTCHGAELSHRAARAYRAARAARA